MKKMIEALLALTLLLSLPSSAATLSGKGVADATLPPSVTHATYSISSDKPRDTSMMGGSSWRNCQRKM